MPDLGIALPLAVSLTTIEQLAVSGVVVGSIYALVALGFNVIFNATGVLNFAQGEFVLLGGFFLYQATAWGVPLLPGALLAVAGVGLVGAVVQLGVVRNTRGEGLIGAGTALLAVSLLLIVTMTWIWGPDALKVPEFTPGGNVDVSDVVITRQQLWVVGVTILVVIVFEQFFRRTTIGIGMRAAALNPDAARGVGISVQRMSLYAYVIGAALAAVGGVLITPIIGVAVGGGFALVIKGFTAALLGGIGDPRGAIIGGILLGLIESISAAFISSGYQEVLPLVVLILVFMIRPGGILGVGVAARA